MISNSAIRQRFTGHFGWQLLDGLPGAFSVTPDRGDFRRVFSAEIKNRFGGKMLLGAIGFQYSSHEKQYPNRLSLFANILNFNFFANAPVIMSDVDLIPWAVKICEAIEYLPDSSNALIDGVNNGHFGPFHVSPFLNSTPWGYDFINSIELRKP